MDNPYITTELNMKIIHMRRRHRIRMWITLVALMMTVYMILLLLNEVPRIEFKLLNNDVIDNRHIINNQINGKGILKYDDYQSKADINKINKLYDLADV